MTTQADDEPFPEPTRPELDILKILWRDGRRSAREIHGELAEPYGWAYSTTRTTLDRMVVKGLLGKAPFHGLHLYEARISRPFALAGLVRDFAERVLETDWTRVVSLFAEGDSLSDEEIAEMKRLLAEAEEQR